MKRLSILVLVLLALAACESVTSPEPVQDCSTYAVANNKC